jgi:DNA-binding cell septation regulator SpoVG
MSRIVLTLVAMPALVLYLAAQTSSKGPAPAPPTAPTMEVHADLRQLMRGILYPAANVVFFAQDDDPAKVKPVPGRDPSMATDPLTSTFGGWQAVESAALALGESANLLLIPGRKCVNGEPVPVNHPDWQRFVQELRDASMKAYKAAQSKNQESMIEVAETMTAACAGCHRKWREKPAADRCK